MLSLFPATMDKLKSLLGFGSKSPSDNKTKPQHNKSELLNNTEPKTEKSNKLATNQTEWNKNLRSNSGAEKKSSSTISSGSKLHEVHQYHSPRAGLPYYQGFTERSFTRNNPAQFLSEVEEEYEHRIAQLNAASAAELERNRRVREKFELEILNREEELLNRVHAAEQADLAMEQERMRRLKNEKPRQHPFLVSHELMSPVDNNNEILDNDEAECYERIISMETAQNIKNVEKSSSMQEQQIYLQLENEKRKFDSMLSAETSRKLQEIERSRLLVEEWFEEMKNEIERMKSGFEADRLEDAEQRNRIQEISLEKTAAELETQKERQLSYEKAVKGQEMERQNQLLMKMRVD